jgi:hypothetical protein
MLVVVVVVVVVIVPTTRVSLHATWPAVLLFTGWLQLCESVTDVPRSKPAGAAVIVPTSVSMIKPVLFVVVFVGISVFSVCEVKVNVKPPAEMATLIAPVNIETVVGVMVPAEPAAIPKFPVDAEVVPGLTRVFAVVAAVMFPAGVRVATPPFPGVNVKLPVAGTACAGLSAVDASNNAPNPVAPIKLVRTLLIFTPFQLAYRITVLVVQAICQDACAEQILYFSIRYVNGSEIR